MPSRLLPLILLLVLVLPASPALGQTPAVTCGTEVAESIVLTEDLHCPGVLVALHVVASGLTVDLGGHTISGAGTTAVFAEPGTSDLVIRDGTIRDVHQAVWLGGSGRTLLDHLRVLDATHFWAVEAGNDTTVSHSHFERTVVAVSLFFGPNGVVEHSTFVDNLTGVFLEDGAGHAVRKNRFVGNEREGVRLADNGGVNDSVVTRNHFERNGFGMRWIGEFSTTGNEVSHNRFFRNRQSGLHIEALHDGVLDGAVIEDNHLDRNGSPAGGGDGLAVVASPEAAAGVTLTGNRAFHNAGYGINAPGVVDGGRNHARHNGESAQCSGVNCTPGRR
jgi:hypothetical protein